MDFKKLTKAYRNELIKKIDQFVSIPSVYDAKTISENTPYGKNVDKVLNAFAKFGKENGFKVERNPRYVELSFGKGPVVEVFGHLDVVPVTDNKLFKMRKDKNNIYGRGVADDKGPLLAATYAIIALKNKGLIKNTQVKIFAGGDEERGSSCLTHYAKTHQAPKFGFTPDCDFPVIYGEKAMTGMIVSKNIKLKNIVSIKGGTAANVVTSEATFKVTNVNKIKNKLKTPHKIKGDEITFIGKSAHGSTPELGKNAFLLGLKELAKINHDQVAYQIANTFLDYTGKKFNAYYKSKLLGETTYSVGVVTYKNNKLTFTVDCRRPENTNHKTIVNKVLKTFNFNLEKETCMNQLLFNPKSPLVTLLMDAYQKETGDYKHKPQYSGGGTYAKEIGNTVAFGPVGVNESYRVHEEKEYFPIKALYNVMSIYAHAVYNFINKKK